MFERNKLIEFTKEKLENLRYLGKRGWWFAKNFEGLCIRVNKHKKSYYVHWSIPKYKDGKSGYLSQSQMPLYFGLGEEEKIEIIWPSGQVQSLSKDIPINSVFIVKEKN